MKERTTIIDLTRPMDGDLEIYAGDGYRDPAFSVQTWCTVSSQGFWVSRLELGTQTGTHIDAPAHFRSGGATLDRLPVENLVGRYFLLDLADDFASGDWRQGYDGQRILFLRCPGGLALTGVQMDALLSLGAPVWAVSGGPEILDEAPLAFHRRLAEADVYLIEDLDEGACADVPADGLLIALPLRLPAVSGSPCRVVVYA